MIDRYIKQEQLSTSEIYDLHYAYDQDSGKIVYWYEFKQKCDNLVQQLANTSKLLTKTGTNVFIMPTFPGNFLNIILSKQKILKIKQKVLIRWIFNLHQELMTLSVLNPSVENIFINTRDSKAFFSMNAYIKSPIIDFCAPTQNSLISHSQFVQFYQQIQGNTIQPQKIQCNHQNQSCQFCKYLLVGFKMILDNIYSNNQTFTQLYEQAIVDKRLKQLVDTLQKPHCQSCCIFKYQQQTLNKDEIQIQNSPRFLFGCSLVQIFLPTQIINYALLNAFYLCKLSVPILLVFPGFYEIKEELQKFIWEFFDPSSTFESLQLNPLFSNQVVMNESNSAGQLSCDYKNKRSDTMTVVWNHNGKKVNQYIMVEDSLDSVAEACFQDELLFGVSKMDIYLCLKDKGTWE